MQAFTFTSEDWAVPNSELLNLDEEEERTLLIHPKVMGAELKVKGEKVNIRGVRQVIEKLADIETKGTVQVIVLK